MIVEPVSTTGKWHQRPSANSQKRGPKPPLGSEKAELGEADGCAAGDDDVIEHTDVNQSQRFTQPAGQDLIGLGRFSDAAWMWMGLMCP